MESQDFTDSQDSEANDAVNNPEKGVTPEEASTSIDGCLPFKKKETRAIITVEKNSESYNMSGIIRGKVIIFNHKEFSNGQKKRTGTDIDEKRLTDCFEKLRFEVKVFKDLEKLDVLAELKKVRKEDHSERNCLVIIVLTHGTENILYAKDESYRPEELWNPFVGNKCPSLAGKPKLFFVQACRGNNTDSGTTLYADAQTDSRNFGLESSAYTVPNWADFFIAFSTPPGYVSWRSSDKGSWFIDSLVTVLEERSKHYDIQSMMTFVTREIALNYQTSPNNKDGSLMKQVPMTSSTLTRFLYF